MRRGGAAAQRYADRIEEAGSARSLLDEELGLLAADELDAAAQEIQAWRGRGIHLATVLDPDYPENLRGVHDRPPLIFIAGHLTVADSRAIAVIGSRQASVAGIDSAKTLTMALVESGFTVVSGLAAGVDTAAHTAALACGGRTIAVIGTGLARSYPPQNAPLQRTIAEKCAVVSQFWPDTPPSRRNFPMRNAVMSGISRGTVLVEASPRSGARIQARLALAHGRPVFLLESLLAQEWARKLARMPGTHIVRSAEQVSATVERLSSTDSLIA